MDVGIGLPAAIPGTDRESLLGWARRADERGFSSLGAIDRLVYPNYEPLVALTAAAAVTERIRLCSSILLGPLRETAVLAKQALTLDDLSGGRFVLGIALGAREDDYTASGSDWANRGRTLDSQLEELRRIWGGEERGTKGAIGPPARDGRPRLIVGGSVDAAYRRAAQHGDGWIMGGGAPDAFAAGAEKMRAAWKAEGREGAPRLMSLAYFALGPDGEKNADWYLHDYYGPPGSFADAIAESAATTPETVQQYVSAFSDAGCEELVFFPCSKDVEQVDLLAEAALS